jgi:hypothetical protein
MSGRARRGGRASPCLPLPLQTGVPAFQSCSTGSIDQVEHGGADLTVVIKRAPRPGTGHTTLGLNSPQVSPRSCTPVTAGPAGPRRWRVEWGDILGGKTLGEFLLALAVIDRDLRKRRLGGVHENRSDEAPLRIANG